MDFDREELVKMAQEAKEKSYSPYSGFRVGAALVCEDGSIYTGCNIENAAYSPCVCAERVAVFKAVSVGNKKIKAIAIASDKDGYISPCGVCRQVLSEFADSQNFTVLMSRSDTDYIEKKLFELLPYTFSKDDIK